MRHITISISNGTSGIRDERHFNVFWFQDKIYRISIFSSQDSLLLAMIMIIEMKFLT